jgi:pimeloyl-ACP methyl ester carboxylesterase
MAPSLAAGVALVEPVLFDFPVAPGADSFAGSRALAERARKRRAVYPSRAAARESLSGRFPYSGFAPECLEAWLEGGLGPHPDGVALRCAPDREAWAYEGAAALDLWPWAARVRAPVALLLAEHSAVPARLADRLAAAVRRCEVVRLPGATHFAALEKPAEVGSALRAFAAGLVP